MEICENDKIIEKIDKIGYGYHQDVIPMNVIHCVNESFGPFYTLWFHIKKENIHPFNINDTEAKKDKGALFWLLFVQFPKQ